MNKWANLLLNGLRGIFYTRALSARPAIYPVVANDSDSPWDPDRNPYWWHDGTLHPDPQRAEKHFIVILTRAQCHLCEQAHVDMKKMASKANRRVVFAMVDLDQYPHLAENYGMLIPVVFINGQERFRGRVIPVFFQRMIEQPYLLDHQPRR